MRLVDLMDDKLFDETLAELKAYIEDNAERAKAIIDELPKSYNMVSMSESFNRGWKTGFRRCLAEVKRLVEANNEGAIPRKKN